jgi:hypothetical protein
VREEWATTLQEVATGSQRPGGRGQGWDGSAECVGAGSVGSGWMGGCVGVQGGLG